MHNMIDYVKSNLKTIAENPLNEVDSLILSQISYIHLDGIVPSLEEGNTVRLQELLQAERFSPMFHMLWDQHSNYSLLFTLAASPRFRNIRLCFFVNDMDCDLEKQFAAVTFHLDDGSFYLAFRGTDATIIGWKEDFNLIFSSPVPSQEAAVRYVTQVAEKTAAPLHIGGHSKGGNLAVYASVLCDAAIQDRIVSIHSHDGPGFPSTFFQSTSYAAVQQRIYKTVPQNSLFGMLLEHQENFRVIESSRHSGIMQHDPFSWIVEKNDFHYLDQSPSHAFSLSRSLNRWLDSLDQQKRECFVETLFQVIQASGATTFAELRSSWQQRFPAMLLAAKNIDSETRNYVIKTLQSLVWATVPFRRTKL